MSEPVKKTDRKPKGYWDVYENNRKEASKYVTKIDFRRKCKSAYDAAHKNGWLETYDWLKASVKPSGYWDNYDNNRNEAMSCKTRAEFKRKNTYAYSIASKNGWLETYDWFVSTHKPKGYWDVYENNREEALKHETISKFLNASHAAYESAVKNGWLESYDWLKRRQKPNGYWSNYDNNYREASKYKTIKEFRAACSGAYKVAIVKGWIRSYDWLTSSQKPKGYWKNYENNRKAALECKSRTEFLEKYYTAYKEAVKHGWLESYDWIDTSRMPYGFWSEENTRQEAMKYKTKYEFCNNNGSAYSAALKHGWLDTYDWFEVNVFTREFKLQLLKSGDLDNMSRHQMIELIMNGKMAKDFKPLVYTTPNSERSRNLIRNLIELYEGNNTDAENQAAIENLEQEERRENEQETRRQVADNGLLSLVVQSPTDEPEEQPEGVAPETYALPSVVARQFQVNDETIKVNPSDKAAEFLIEEDIAKLWNAMLYANEKGLDGQELESLKEMECGEFSGYVRDKFVSEYEIVTSIKEDADYRFYVDGKYCRPLLMQKLMAYKMSTHDCYGNWCGTGAGKTNAFLFSTRYVQAKTSVVFTPNGVVDSLAKAIKRIYPNSNIVIPNSPEDIKPYNKDQYTYIIFNYEKFQEHARAKAYINRLFETNTIDFVCLDEVQNIKVRDEKYASNRSKYINAFLVKARKQRPGMKTLVMTATPCPNSLSEVRSIIETLTGKKHPEIGNRSNSVTNVHNAYKALLLNGFRYVPKYPIVLNERTVEINCTDDTELYTELSNRDNDVNDIEYILAKRKLSALKDEIKDGTIVYSNWVDGMAGMLEEKIRSWGFTVECYNGQCGGKVERAEIMQAFIDSKINVLVCSQPVTTGIDGLQYRSNKLIYVSLPWTYDDKTQTDGRLYRQRSAFKSVDVVIPQVTITMPNGEVWSWDRARLGAIETKRSLSAAVLDGYLQDSYRLSREHLKKLALKALRDGFNENEVERQDIELEVGLEETDEQRKVRRQNYVSEVHRRGNSSNHNTMHRYFNEHPDVFNTYHDSRDTDGLAKDTVLPVAEFINSHYTGKKIADLGCGVNMLSTLVKNGNTVTGFDHQRYKGHDEVVIADIGNLNGIVNDEEMDVAVFCLSLWGQDYEDYFNEAFRILSKNGVMFVVEPTSDFGENERFGTEEDFTDMVEGYGFSRLGKVKKHHGFAFFRFEKE